MTAEVKKEIALEIAHVLFIDIVGYSKLSINDQHAAVEELNRIVRATEQFQKAEASERLIKIATGDGMALVFYTSPDTPVRCPLRNDRHFQKLAGTAPKSPDKCDFQFTVTATGAEGIPLATTTRVLGPCSWVTGTSKWVDTKSLEATAMLLWSCVRL